MKHRYFLNTNTMFYITRVKGCRFEERGGKRYAETFLDILV